MQETVKLQEKVEFSNAFRDFIKNRKYESYVLRIIEKSTVIFAGKTFFPVATQSNGEPDFYDNNRNKYEVKLLLDSTQGGLLGERKNDISEWFISMNKACEEFADIILGNNMSMIKTLSFYRIMKARIESVEKDEKAILFIPFPLVLDSKRSVLSQLALDLVQAVYNQLDEDGVIDGREVYFIYPSADKGEYVLRDSNYHREYIRIPELDDLIVFETTV